MKVQVLDILARNYVDFAVPVIIKVVKGSELLLLLLGKSREIFCYSCEVMENLQQIQVYVEKIKAERKNAQSNG